MSKGSVFAGFAGGLLGGVLCSGVMNLSSSNRAVPTLINDSLMEGINQNFRNLEERIEGLENSPTIQTAYAVNSSNGDSSVSERTNVTPERDSPVDYRVLVEIEDRVQKGVKAGILHGKTGLGLDTCRKLYDSFNDDRMEAVTYAAQTVSHIGPRLGLSPDQQVQMVGDLTEQRRSYFADKGYDPAGLNRLALTDEAAFTQILRDYRETEGRWLAEYFGTGKGASYVDREKQSRTLGYLFGEMGKRHIEQGIVEESARFVEAAKRREFRFVW